MFQFKLLFILSILFSRIKLIHSQLCIPSKSTIDAFCKKSKSGNDYVKTPWFGSWAYNKTITSIISQHIINGNIVQIKDAFDLSIAMQLQNELDLYNGWIIETSENPDRLQFHRRCMRKNVPPFLYHFHVYLKSTGLEFFSQFPKTQFRSWSCLGKDEKHFNNGPFATEYSNGDFLSPHTDFTIDRSLSFILSLSKNWKKSYGGELWWFNGRTERFTPEFNTLYLFTPSPRSHHFVSTVIINEEITGDNDSIQTCNDDHRHCDGTFIQNDGTSRRFSISGWYESVDPLHTTSVQYRLPLDSSRLLVVN
jgi:hypothetical protein